MAQFPDMPGLRTFGAPLWMNWIGCGQTLASLTWKRPITRSDDYARKGINYRMAPENADCLSAAGIDCCVLANNHVLDWGQSGLLQTLATLERLKIKAAGAGRNVFEAAAPAALDLADKARVLVFSFGDVTSGIPRSWAATTDIPGVNLLTRLSEAGALRAAEYIVSMKQPEDLAVVSLHWGSNWGYEIPAEHRLFARTLIDRANVSIIHGHSSHHMRAIEVYHQRLILYGCGDFLNDYEGIRGYEEYRSDLALMYFADIEPKTGNLAAFEIIPLQIRNFRLNRPLRQDIELVATDAASGMSAVHDRHRAQSRRPARPFPFDVHSRIAPPTISFDPGQSTPLVPAVE